MPAMAPGPRIILVDDEIDLAAALAEYLSDLGYRVETADGGAELDVLLRRGPPDLIVLDLSMPGESGRAILGRLKPRVASPVIVLTANADEIDRVLCLEMGADDFVIKPVVPRELAARIAALLKRYTGVERRLMRFETCSADLGAARLLHDDGRIDKLGPGEVELLRLFQAKAGRILTRAELIEMAPAENRDAFDRAIDNRIMRLRRKLGTDFIKTARGRGYIFEPPE